MIVRPNGTYETNSMFPDSNWYLDEPDNYVVDETTEQGKALAQKVVANYPFYNLVVVDGVLTDVEPREPLPGEIPESPEPEKTPEQLRIEALEAQVAQQEVDAIDFMLAITDLYEQVLALQAAQEGGTA